MGSCLSTESHDFPQQCWDQLKEQIKPLDLIFVRGADYISASIRMVERLQIGNGDWSHVGIVVTPELIDIENAKSGQLCIWESTMSGSLADGVYNLETGKACFGVQVRDLESMVKAQIRLGATVAWCRLKENPWLQKEGESEIDWHHRQELIRARLEIIRREHGHAFYDANALALCGAACPCIRPIRDVVPVGENWIFCSELATIIYCAIDIFDHKKVDPKNVIPTDLTSGLDQDQEIPVVIDPPFIIEDCAASEPAISPEAVTVTI